MMRNVGRMLMVAGLVGVVTSLAGCHGYRDLVDTCYPDRYSYQAHLELNEAFAPQVRNGHVLNQTIWNYHFQSGTAALNASGQLHLASLARTRPKPDPVIFLQAANDVTYDPDKIEEYVRTKEDLTTARIEAVQKYLTAHTQGRGLHFQVVVHDPPVPSQSAAPVDNAIRLMYTGSQANLPGGGGAASVSGGGN